MFFLADYQIGFAQVSKMFKVQWPLSADVDPDQRTYLAQDKLPPNWLHTCLIARLSPKLPLSS